MARFWRALVVLGLAVAAPVEAAKPDRQLEQALRAHIAILASDEFGGREPGTPGETKTLRYLAQQWFEIGLVSGTNDPGNPWFAPVELIAREPERSFASFARARRALPLPRSQVLVLTSDERNLVRDAPLVFVGHGLEVPPQGELAGRIAVMLDSVPAGVNEERAADRQARLLQAGAAAVLTVLDGERTLDAVAARRARAGYALAEDRIGGDLEAYVSRQYAARLFGAEFTALVGSAGKAGFRPRPLGLTATLEATTRESRISTHNLIGLLPGRRPGSGAVLLLAHWDHFGTCAAPPAEDLICNGAIDNASGLAVLTEVARVLAKGKRLERDVYFLATTGEELGLLGAHAFAENPPLPLEQIAAAFNIDSPAMALPGQPLSIVGIGRTPLDRAVGRVARQQRRRLRQSPAAADFLTRQDGWALLHHDVPAIMVSSSYADPARVARFMETIYHRPSDEVTPELDLRGAAEHARLHVALVRWFASPRNYPAPRRSASGEGASLTSSRVPA